MTNIRQLLEASYNIKAVTGATKELANRGHPRVGSVGCVVDDRVYGVCHRIAMLRKMGIEEKPSLSTRIMWTAGEDLEDRFAAHLEAGLGTAAIKRHNEYEIRAAVPGVNKAILGHPDIVIEIDGKPILGIEHKGVFGGATAVSVWREGRPKNDNLIQAAAYSTFLGVPWELWYTCASWVNAYGGAPIQPFYKGFELFWGGGSGLSYQDQDNGEITDTCVTKQGILDYYRLVEEMPVAKDLGPRLCSDYVDGVKHKQSSEAGCKYCVFKSSCAQYDKSHDYDEWLRNVTETIA